MMVRTLTRHAAHITEKPSRVPARWFGWRSKIERSQRSLENTWRLTSCHLHTSTASDASGLPAHCVYRPEQIADAATLLLVARSAAQSNYSDAQFWRLCSLQALRLLASEANLQQLASFADAAVSVRHHDSELMYLDVHEQWRACQSAKPEMHAPLVLRLLLQMLLGVRQDFKWRAKETKRTETR